MKMLRRIIVITAIAGVLAYVGFFTSGNQAYANKSYPSQFAWQTALGLSGMLGSSGAQASSPMQPVGTSRPTTVKGIHLKNTNSGMCLVARVQSGEAPVRQVPCEGYDDQYWTFQANRLTTLLTQIVSIPCDKILQSM